MLGAEASAKGNIGAASWGRPRGAIEGALRQFPASARSYCREALQHAVATAPAPATPSRQPRRTFSSRPCSAAAAPPRDAAAPARPAPLLAPRRAGLACCSTLCGCSGVPERRQQRRTAAASRSSRRSQREWQPRRRRRCRRHSAAWAPSLSPATGPCLLAAPHSWTPTAWHCPRTSASLRAPSRSRCAVHGRGQEHAAANRSLPLARRHGCASWPAVRCTSCSVVYDSTARKHQLPGAGKQAWALAAAARCTAAGRPTD